jgi:hypothetical protein
MEKNVSMSAQKDFRLGNNPLNSELNAPIRCSSFKKRQGIIEQNIHPNHKIGRMAIADKNLNSNGRFTLCQI